jgi:hypothetical protein
MNPGRPGNRPQSARIALGPPVPGSDTTTRPPSRVTRVSPTVTRGTGIRSSTLVAWSARDRTGCSRTSQIGGYGNHFEASDSRPSTRAGSPDSAIASSSSWSRTPTSALAAAATSAIAWGRA